MSRYQQEARWLYAFIGLFLLLLAYTIYTHLKPQNSPVSNINYLSDKSANYPPQTKTYEALLKERDSLQQKLTFMQHTPQPIVGGFITDDGLHYEVQIGAFKYFNLHRYRQSFNHLHNDEEDGLDKYTLAKFTTYSEAEAFKKDIQRMGIKDAFIVAKIDGKRVDIKAALKAEKQGNAI